MTDAMALPEYFQNRIFALIKRFKYCKVELKRLDDMDGDDHEKLRDEDFLSIFKDACALVKEAEAANAPHLLEVADAAQKVLNKCIEYAYGDAELFDFMPSWAHDNQDGRPLVEDRSEVELPLPHGAVPKFIRALRISPEEAKKMIPVTWNESMKRHPKSTRLARFRPDLPALSPTPTSPLAMSVCDARCEVSSTGITAPIRLQMSRGGACLALAGMGGYKNRSPTLSYFLLDKAADKLTGLPKDYFLEIGLAGIAYHMSVDESRRLIFVGDDNRVKSYAWGAPDGTCYKKPLAIHTLNSKHFNGPIAVLPNGTIVRAGKGGANAWEATALETHGDDGQKRVGKNIDAEDTERDDPEEIELSSGSAPASLINFVDQPKLKPNVWQPLISTPSTVLCAEFARDSNNYGCVAIDLEHGGKTTARYLGHGATVAEFSVSATDPQVFLTACHDGFARLFDVRQSLPALTFDACGQDEFCEAIALAHPDGVPIVFTGTSKHEQIKVWDVRARTPVYELATGNNSVESLAWDSKHNCLYAATECSYMDRLGNHHGYRRAKIPKRANESGSGPNEDKEMDEGEDTDEDDDDDDDDERCWPKGAWHGEDFFGYTFDAGEHRIYRYAFKEDPDTTVVPVYGDATIGSGGF